MARNRLINLWTADPHCFHCGRLTVIAEKFAPGVKHPRGDNEATVEHVLERKQYGWPVTVLACNRCNDGTKNWIKGLIRKQN